VGRRSDAKQVGRSGMMAGNYGRGCGITPLVTEAGSQESAELRETAAVRAVLVGHAAIVSPRPPVGLLKYV